MPVKLFNLDLHVSVIEDVKYIFKNIYGDNVEITNWSISGHNWIFNKDTPEVIGITNATWMNFNQDMMTALLLHIHQYFPCSLKNIINQLFVLIVVGLISHFADLEIQRNKYFSQLWNEWCNPNN